jgi:hypothetical protein
MRLLDLTWEHLGLDGEVMALDVLSVVGVSG